MSVCNVCITVRLTVPMTFKARVAPARKREAREVTIPESCGDFTNIMSLHLYW